MEILLFAVCKELSFSVKGLLFSNSKADYIKVILFLFLWLRKLRLREMNYFSRSHRNDNWEWNLDSAWHFRCVAFHDLGFTGVKTEMKSVEIAFIVYLVGWITNRFSFHFLDSCIDTTEDMYRRGNHCIYQGPLTYGKKM